MEKQMAEQAERQWQYQFVAHGQKLSRKEYAKAYCKPWSSYAQTSSRLKAALKGHDAVNIPNEGACNPDSCSFIVCLPFYGVLVAKLQSTVRAFYDIEGSETQDWRDGCCCPCFALVRAENEIIFRESKHFQQNLSSEPKESRAMSDPSGEVYTTEPPMEVLAPMPTQMPGPPRARSSSSTSCTGKDSERDSPSLSTIPEASREASAAGLAGEDGPKQAQVKPPAKPHALGDDSTVPIPMSNSNFPLLNYLGRQWFLVPVNTNKENSKSGQPPMRKDDEVPVEVIEKMLVDIKPADRGLWRMFRRNKTPQTAEMTVKHELEDDTSSSRAGTIALQHALVEHSPATSVRGSRFAEHLLQKDRVSHSAVPTINVSHELSDDPIFLLPAESGKHPLSQHQSTPQDVTAFKTLNDGESPDTAIETQAMSAESESPGVTAEAQAKPAESAETTSPDKSFVASFFSGIAPLRNTQAPASAPAHKESDPDQATDSANAGAEATLAEKTATEVIHDQ